VHISLRSGYTHIPGINLGWLTAPLFFPTYVPRQQILTGYRKIFHILSNTIPPCFCWIFPLFNSFNLHRCTLLDPVTCHLYVPHVQTISIDTLNYQTDAHNSKSCITVPIPLSGAAKQTTYDQCVIFTKTPQSCNGSVLNVSVALCNNSLKRKQDTVFVH